MVARPGEGPTCSTDSVPWGSGWGRSLDGEAGGDTIALWLD